MTDSAKPQEASTLKKISRRFPEGADFDDSQDWAPEGPVFLDDDWQDSQAFPPAEEKMAPHTIFRPRVRQPHFILSVLVNAVRILGVLILVGSLALVGAVPFSACNPRPAPSRPP